MNDLNFCYYNSDFTFSSEAIKWIEDTYYHPFKNTYVPYDKYATTDTGKKLLENKISWEGTLAIKELREYLTSWGIDPDYIGSDLAGPDVFVSNDMNKPQIGFPHIDGYKWDDINPNKRLPVLTRFNVVIKYNPNDSMFWWEDDIDGHPLVGIQNHDSLGGYQNFQYLAIKGHTGEDKWKNLRKPSKQAIVYKNHQSAFLRTDCAHCVNIDEPGFRLVVALALPYSLEQLYKNKGLI